MKVEVPVNVAFLAGSKACKGESAYTRGEAKEHFCRDEEAFRLSLRRSE
jgi:hypothetical protein